MASWTGGESRQGQTKPLDFYEANPVKRHLYDLGRSGVPIRVCYIISSFRPVVGGAERGTEVICKKLVEQGVDVVVLTRYHAGLSRYEELDGIPVYRLGYPSWRKLGSLLFALHALWFLATHLRRFQIIHVQNIDTPLLIGLVCKLLFRRYLIATIHGEAKILMKKHSPVGKARLTLMRSLVDTFCAVSPAMHAELSRLGVPRSRIHYAPTGVDTTHFHYPSREERREARRSLGLGESEVVVLYVGRLVALKRVDLILQAWSRLRLDFPRQLLIAGDGPERDRLEQLAAELGVQNVRFEGIIDDVVSYMRAADIFLLTSQREGLSQALLEAMATGLAVIVTAVPGNLALVRDGENGFVVPVDDLDALADRMSVAIQSADQRREIGRSARRTICAGYSLDASADKHRALYTRVLEQRPGRWGDANAG